jgi:hypothetical protein
MKLQQFQHDYIVDLNHYLKGINKSLLAGGTVPKVKRVYLNASLIANEKHHEISLSLAIAPLGIKQEYLISLSELYGTYADVIEMTIDDISAKLQRHIIATSLVSALNTVI